MIGFESYFKFNHSLILILNPMFSTGTRIRTLIKGFGDLYSTVELFPCV